jgi:hypothetical protein
MYRCLKRRSGIYLCPQVHPEKMNTIADFLSQIHSSRVSSGQGSDMFFPIFETSGWFFSNFENYPKVHIIFRQIGGAPTGLGMQKHQNTIHEDSIKGGKKW